jgi:ATP-dependent protease ClpP protease subunit/phage major head subunit gpT-like protein
MPAPSSKIQLRFNALAPSSTQTAELLIYGDIGISWDERSLDAHAVAERLAALPADVERIDVRINSLGGSVADGLAIYNRLKAHPAKVRVYIDGVAASIASVIAMAGDEILMPETALLMIHAPWGALAGNAQHMREFAQALDQHGAAMVAAYANKTGRPKAQLLALLEDGQDHWFTAEEALAEKFIDSIESGEAQPALETASAFSAAIQSRTPPRIAAALRRNQPVGESTMPDPVAAAPRSTVAGPIAQLMLSQYGHMAEIRNLVMDNIGGRLTEDELGQRVLAHLGSLGQPLNGGGSGGGFEAGGRDGSDFMAGSVDALLIRAGIRIADPHPAARDFANTSVVEIARASLTRDGRQNRHFGNEAPEAVIRAAMTTSAFPYILENALNKAIRFGMETASSSHRNWCRMTTARDFKAQSRVLLGSAPALKAVLEHGEYENGPLTEDRASLVPSKFGRIVSLSWEALVNDDLGAFLSIGPGLGLAALRAEADQLYSLLTTAALAGVTMQDGKALFHADHNNSISFITGTGKPLNAAALGAARAKLRRQTGSDGAQFNLAPRTLLVPPERESEAEILVASSTIHVGQAGAEAAAGWMRALQVIAEPRLANTDTVYLVADSSMIDCGEVSILTSSPELIEEDGFTVDCRRWKMRHSFATGILDHRGIVKLTLTAA